MPLILGALITISHNKYNVGMISLYMNLGTSLVFYWEEVQNFYSSAKEFGPFYGFKYILLNCYPETLH